MDFLETARQKVRELQKAEARPVDPIEVLDRFFASEVMPRLARLHTAGRLPDLAACPLWGEVDRLWGVPNPDPEAVKEAMLRAVETYEKPRLF